MPRRDTRLQAVYTEFREQGVQFLGVDVKDERQLATAFMSNVGAEYQSLFDPRGEVALAFRGFPANVVPSTILLDTGGRADGWPPCTPAPLAKRTFVRRSPAWCRRTTDDRSG